LPIFVWLWFAVYRSGGGRAWTLALAWLLIADFLSPFNLLAAVPVANILQSYMYFGALLLLGLLLRSREGAMEPASDLLPLPEGL
jgi:alpha-1,2-mannosyltransferase